VAHSTPNDSRPWRLPEDCLNITHRCRKIPSGSK